MGWSGGCIFQFILIRVLFGYNNWLGSGCVGLNYIWGGFVVEYGFVVVDVFNYKVECIVVICSDVGDSDWQGCSVNFGEGCSVVYGVVGVQISLINVVFGYLVIVSCVEVNVEGFSCVVIIEVNI